MFNGFFRFKMSQDNHKVGMQYIMYVKVLLFVYICYNMSFGYN